MVKAVSKFSKYLITDLKQDIVEGAWTEPMQKAGKGQDGRLLWLDNEVIPGAFYLETTWAYPQKKSDPPNKYPHVVSNPHKHEYDEVLAFIGTDQNAPHDLCGEIEFRLDGEKFTITRSALIFIPKGLQHGPLIIRNVDKPIFVFSTGPGKMYF